jgi:hypothetical protein
MFSSHRQSLRTERRVENAQQTDYVAGVHLDTATIWSAPAERSGDGAVAPACLATLKAVSPESFRGCHRTPYIPHTTNWVVVARCTQFQGSDL